MRLSFKRLRLVAAVLVTVPMAVASGADARSPDPYAEQIIAADEAGRRLARVSEIYPDIDEARAYLIQKDVTDLKLKAGEEIVGYKAGLTSSSSQRMFKTDGPIFGSLFRSGSVRPGSTVSLGQFRGLVMECEIGFVFAKEVRKPVSTVAELQKLVMGVRPAIELPDNAFITPPASAIDLIPNNVGSTKYIFGPVHFMQRKDDINKIQVTLSLNDHEIERGSAIKLSGGQWVALQSIVNLALTYGYAIERGQTIITGSLAVVTSVQPGNYHADFGEIGQIRFAVTP